MLPAAHRMRRSDDFAAAIRSGARSGGPRVVVHVLVPPDAAVDGAQRGPAVVGLVVSKAVGTAVVRTRVKRRLRHQLTPRLAVLPAGSRVVVRALPPSAGADSADLGADLDVALATALRRAAARPARPAPVPS